MPKKKPKFVLSKDKLDDGHNILDLNCKVHAPLLKAGNIWFPRYAA